MLFIHHASRLVPSTEKGREPLNLNTENPFFSNYTHTEPFLLPFCGNASVVGNEAIS